MADKVINATNSNTVVTITGLKDGADVAFDETAKTVTISKDDLNESDVTIKSAKGTGTGANVTYKLVLAGDVFTEAYNWTAPKVAETAKEGPVTVTYRCQTTSNYKLSGAKITYSKTPYVTTQNIFSISGVNNSTLKGKDSGSDKQSEAIAALFTLNDSEGKELTKGTQTASIAVTPKEAAFTTAKMTISTMNAAKLPNKTDKHTITMPASLSTIHDKVTYSYRWEFNGATGVAYKETKNAYYEDAAKSNNTTINYTPAKTSAIATVNGISKDFKTKTEADKIADDYKATTDPAKTSDEVFVAAIIADAEQNDSSALVAARAAYNKALYGGEIPTEKQRNTYAALDETAKKKKQATALTAAKTAYLKDAAIMDALSDKIAAKFDLPDTITHDSANKLSAYSGEIAVDSDLFDNKNITITKGTSADGKKKSTFTLKTRNYTPSDKTYAWSFDNATSASYKETLDAHYEADSKTGGIKYTAKKTATLAKVAGLNPNFKTNIEDAQTKTDVTLAKMNLIETQKPATPAPSYTGATLVAYEAYNKSLYGSAEPTGKQIENYDKLDKTAKEKKQETALKAAKTAYLKDETVMKDVSDKIAETLTGLTDATSGKTLTVKKDALGTTNVTLNGGKDLDNKTTSYTLAVGKGALDGTDYKTPAHFTDGNNNEYTLVVTGATAKLQKLTKTANYEVGKQGKNPVIKYIKATTGTKADETLFTITGLKAGIAPDGAGSYDNFLKVDATNHTITLADSVLGTANIVLKDTDPTNDWKLSITANADKNIYNPTYTASTATATANDAKLTWSATKGTAKLTQTIEKKGHTLSHDGKTIYYNAGTAKSDNTKEILLATVSGLDAAITDEANAKANLEYSFTSGPVISVKKAALGGKTISVNGTGNFEINLASDVTDTSGTTLGKSKETGPALTLTSATAKYSTILGPGYSIDTTGKKINYLARGTKETVEAQISGFTNLYKELSTAVKTAVTKDTMTGTAPTAPTEPAADASDTVKAKYKTDKSEYDAIVAARAAYTTQAEGTSDANALKAAQQAYIDSKAKEVIVLNEDGIAGTTDDKTFTLHKGAIGGANLVINTKGDYKIALATGEDIATTKPDDANAWNISNGTATWQKHTPEYYELATGDKAGKQITFHKEVWDKTALVKLTGLNKNTTESDLATPTASIVSLNYGALGTTPILMTTSGDYRTADLALNSTSTDTANYVKYQSKPTVKVTGWIINGATATYQEFTPAYYTIDNSTNKITYNAVSDKGDALITVTGIKTGLTTDADGNVTGDLLKLSMKTSANAATTNAAEAATINVELKAGALDTKNNAKTTIKGTGDYEKAVFTFSASDAPTAIAQDKLALAYSGNNVVLQAPKDIQGYICDGQSVTYSDGSANRPTLASIAGLKTDLDGKDSRKNLSDVVTFNSSTGVITLKNSALNDKSVNLTTTGAYTLDLFKAKESDDDTVKKENVQIVSTALKYAYQNADDKKGNVLITQGAKAGDYEVDSTGKKVTYYASDKPTTLATISGVKENLDSLSSVLTLNQNTKTVTVLADALDADKKTPIKVTTAGYTLIYANDIFKDTNPTVDYNSTTKKVELAKVATSAGWGLAEDGKSINYYAQGAKAPAVASISGLKAIDDNNKAAVLAAVKIGTVGSTGFTEGAAGTDIQLGGAALGTANVSITDTAKKGYKLTLDEIVYKEDGKVESGSVNTADDKTFDGWVVSGTKATYKTGATKAYYTLKNNAVSYTAPSDGKEVVTVSGIKSGLVPDDKGKIWSDQDNTKQTIEITNVNKIFLDKYALNEKEVTVDKDTYTLSLVDEGERKVNASTTTYEWSVAANGTTASYNEVVSGGYAYDTTSKSIKYTAPKTTSVATLTGFNPNIKSDAEYAAETNVTEYTMYNVAETTAKAYKGAQKAAYEAYQAKLPTTGTASEPQKATALTAAKTAYVTTAMADTIANCFVKGKLSTTAGDNPVTTFGGDDAGTVFQIKDKAILGFTDLKLAGTGGYTFDLSSTETTKPATTTATGNAWIVNGTKAELYENATLEYYSASSDKKTVSYTAAVKPADAAAKPVATLTGLKSGLKNGSWSNLGVTINSKAITLTQAVLPTADRGTVTVDGDGYKLAIGANIAQSDISKSNPVTPAKSVWTLKNNVATYSQDQKKGYALNEDETEITYILKDRTEALATVKNLNPELDEIIKDVLKEAGTEEPGSDANDEKKAAYATAYSTKLATYFTAGETADTEKTFTVDKDAIYSDGDAKRTITIDSKYGYTIKADVEAAADASVGTGGYSWTLSNGNADYKYSQVAGLVTAADYTSITYNPDVTTTTLAKLTGFNKTFTADADKFAKNVTVKNDDDNKPVIIELTAAALKDTTAVKIATNNRGYYLAASDVTTATAANPPKEATVWVIDAKNGTAEYVKGTPAYYQKDDAEAPQSLTYTAATKKADAKEVYKITGLSKSFTADDITITDKPFNVDGGTSSKAILLSEKALSGTTKVTLAYGESADEDVRLGLGNSSGTTPTQMIAVKAKEPKDSEWSVSGTTATLNQTRPKGYELTNATTITNIKTDQTSKLVTISGVPNYTTEATTLVTSDTMEKPIANDDTNKVALTAAKTAYEAKLTELNVTKDNATTAQKTQAVTAAKAAYINTKVGKALVVGTKEVEVPAAEQGGEPTKTTVPIITVNQNALGTATVSLTNGKDVNGTASTYVLDLDEAVATDTTVKDTWYVSGTTAQYIKCVPAHYAVGNDGKITYTAKAKAASAEAEIVITGLKSGTDSSQITFSGTEGAAAKIVTLPKDILGTGTTQITTGEDYTLDFKGTDTAFKKAAEIKPTWAEGATTKLNLVQPANTYMLSKDAKSITYSSGGNTTTLATIGGLVSAPKFTDLATATTTAITIKGNQIASNNVTVDGMGVYTFNFSEYNGTADAPAKITGSTNADTLTPAGVGLEITGGKGDDTINLAEVAGVAARTVGNKIVFAAGDGNDTVTHFDGADYIKTAVAANSITVDRNGDNVVVQFGADGADGTITLTSYSKTADVHFVNSSNTDITENVEGAKYAAPGSGGGDSTSRSLLYDDNYMETTPVLSSITEITADDYSVGNIEGAADLTKLTKEETPIIASSK